MKSHTLAKMLLDMPDCDVVLPWMDDRDEPYLESVEFCDGRVNLDNYAPRDHHIETHEEHVLMKKNRLLARNSMKMLADATYPELPNSYRLVNLEVPSGY
jgi:hypothetical protein